MECWTLCGEVEGSSGKAGGKFWGWDLDAGPSVSRNMSGKSSEVIQQRQDNLPGSIPVTQWLMHPAWATWGNLRSFPSEAVIDTDSAWSTLFTLASFFEDCISLLRAAITKYHRLDGINNRFILFPLWRLKGQDQDISFFWSFLLSLPWEGYLFTVSSHGHSFACSNFLFL
jgi:hypothetical protein